MTATGAVLIAMVLGPTAWLILRGGPATGRTAPQDEESGPGLNGLPRTGDHRVVNASASRTSPVTQTTPEDVRSG